MSQSRKPIAILVADGFIEPQVTQTQKALFAAERPYKLIGAEGRLVHGWHEAAWGHHFMADAVLSDVLSADFDALLVPDGEHSIARLLRNPHARRLIKAFVETGKPSAFIGAAVTLLAEAGVAAGRTVAAVPQAQAALASAGATVSAEPRTVDGNLLTASDASALSEILRWLTDQAGSSTASAVGQAA